MPKCMMPCAILILFLATILTAGTALGRTLSEPDETIYQAAFHSLKKETWRHALMLAQQAKDKQLAKVIVWLDYQRDETSASFSEISLFVKANPSWPRLHTLRRQAERNIKVTFDYAEIIKWFEEYPPLTGEGTLAYIGALSNTSQEDTAKAVLRKTWTTLKFQSVVQENRLVKLFGHYLTQKEHAERLERLLWARETAAAERILGLVTQNQRALATARIRLIRMSAGVDTAIADVPASIRKHPGLQLDRMRWRRRKNKNDAAIELLTNAPKDLGNAEHWFEERAILTRRALANGQHSIAYRMISDHRLERGKHFAEGEFLSGWIQLTFLDNPHEAHYHFERLYHAVKYPVSQARGAYWSGRAANAKGDTKSADRWYEKASMHPETYYGQLAAREMATAPAFNGEISKTAPDSLQWKKFDEDELVITVRQLNAVGHSLYASAFLYELGRRAEDAIERQMAAQLAHEVGRYEQSIFIAKTAERLGENLRRFKFPIIDVEAAPRIQPSLLLATVRQESSFETDATSPAGARGLMQLMPATAKRVAHGLGLNYHPQRLHEDTEFNLRIGSEYLANYLARYNGSRALALASYNAGPGRTSRWLSDFGDPRNNDIDVIDWIEAIPLAETRNYIQRILEAEVVYSWLLSNSGQLAGTERE